LKVSKPLSDQIVLTRAEAVTIEAALTKTIVQQIAFSDDTPYKDDPRWSPWTRWQKPLVNRCDKARKLLREKLAR
jgi:hypothetical protein